MFCLQEQDKKLYYKKKVANISKVFATFFLLKNQIIMDIANIFALPTSLPKATEKELFEPLLQNDNILIERIVSTGQITPTNEWYEQERAEWVVLLQGEAKILLDNEEGEIVNLQKGDYVFIESMRKHRVVFTSLDEACVWLAIHLHF